MGSMSKLGEVSNQSKIKNPQFWPTVTFSVQRWHLQSSLNHILPQDMAINSKGPQEPARVRPAKGKPLSSFYYLFFSSFFFSLFFLSCFSLFISFPPLFPFAKTKGLELMPTSPEIPLLALHEEHFSLKSQRATTTNWNKYFCFSSPM